MTNPAYEATNSDVPHLINDAKKSSFVMEYISNFQPEDIDSDDVDLRFEADGVDTGCDVSIVDQCGKAATLIDSLIAALEQAQQRDQRYSQREHARMRQNVIDGLANHGEVQWEIEEYMVRWDKEHPVECAAYRAELEALTNPNGMMQLSNELAEMKRKCAELQEQKDKWAAWAIALGAKADELESRPLCVKSDTPMREAAPLCVKLPCGTGWASDPYNHGRNNGINECANAIRSAGGTVEGIE